jgi:hypothetical protein
VLQEQAEPWKWLLIVCIATLLQLKHVPASCNAKHRNSEKGTGHVFMALVRIVWTVQMAFYVSKD